MYNLDLKLVDATGVPRTYAGAAIDDSQTDAKLLELMNIERAKRNLTPFESHSKLVAAAIGHAADMADNNTLSHYGIIDHTTWADRCRTAGYPGANLETIGETVAAGQPDWGQVISAWMQSPGHRVIILSTKFQHVGSASRISSKGYIYWASDFGYGGGDEPAPTSAPDNMLIS